MHSNEGSNDPNVTTTVADASAGDVAGFHSESYQERLGDLASVMMGEQNNAGAVHDLEPRGITTAQRQDITEFQQPEPANLIPHQPQFSTPQAPQQSATEVAGEQDFKKLYGDSENEKGQLRKGMQELMTAYKGLLEQSQQAPQAMQSPLAPLPIQPQQFNAAPTSQPQLNTFTNQQAPADPFAGRTADDVVTVNDVQAMVQSQISPQLAQLQEQNLISQQASQAVQIQMAKQAAGITPQLEQRAIAANPTLQYVAAQDYGAYLQQVQGMAQQFQQQDAQQAAQLQQLEQLINGNPKAAQPVAPQVAQVAQRRTFVESSNPSGGGESAPAATPEAVLQAQLAEVAQKYPYGHPLRAKAEGAVLEAAGLKRQSGYRDPAVRAL